MKDASQFPITQGYGYDPSYPLNGGYHRGIDYGCPVGTPVVVNGVTIGLSGATGYVTGAHLHIGRFAGGVATDPGVGNGFNFASATVTQVSSDPTNGNFVRVQADGASWVYLHLSQQNVSVGQQLINSGPVAQEEPMIQDTDNEFARFVKLGEQVRGRPLSRDEFRNVAVGNNWLHVIETLSDDPEANAHVQLAQNALVDDNYKEDLYVGVLKRTSTNDPGSEGWLGQPGRNVLPALINSDENKSKAQAQAAKDKLIGDLQTADQVDKATIQKQLDQITQLEAAAKASASATTGIDQATKDQIANTNSVVNWIKNFLQSIKFKFKK